MIETMLEILLKHIKIRSELKHVFVSYLNVVIEHKVWRAISWKQLECIVVCKIFKLFNK